MSRARLGPPWHGVTWQEYKDEIEDRLNDLHSRVHRGAANAPLRNPMPRHVSPWEKVAVRSVLRPPRIIESIHGRVLSW
jgi:hypothetical protein